MDDILSSISFERIHLFINKRAGDSRIKHWLVLDRPNCQQDDEKKTGNSEKRSSKKSTQQTGKDEEGERWKDPRMECFFVVNRILAPNTEKTTARLFLKKLKVVFPFLSFSFLIFK